MPRTRLENIHGPRGQQGYGRERDQRLDHHEDLGPAGKNGRVGGREGGAGVKGEKQVVDEARDSSYPRPSRVWLAASSVICGNRKAPSVWTPRNSRARGPPASSRQYQEAKTMTFVIHRAAAERSMC